MTVCNNYKYKAEVRFSLKENVVCCTVYCTLKTKRLYIDHYLPFYLFISLTKQEIASSEKNANVKTIFLNYRKKLVQLKSVHTKPDISTSGENLV